MHATTPGIKALLSGSFIDLGIWNGSVLSWTVSGCSAKCQALCQAESLRLSTPTTSCLCTYVPRLVPQPQLPSLAILARSAHHARSPALVWQRVLTCPSYFIHLPLDFLRLMQLATTLKQISRYVHRKDKLNFCSGHKISYNKMKAFYHWLLLVPPG